MDLNEKIELWNNFPNLEPDLRSELDNMTDNEKKEAFSTDLAFGTGGLRGILGAGTNRMNVYIVRKATLGFGRYLARQKDALNKGVAISHDNRHKSREFAMDSAKVLASLGFNVYLFEDLRPTPELSFAVRHLNCIGGIMITASHNPKEYNGYKIYDENGCQLVPDLADQVIDEISKIDNYFEIETTKNNEKISIIGKEVDDAYIARVKQIVLRPNIDKKVKMVYTPLHGTGSVFSARVLQEVGYDVCPLACQMTADPDFSNVKTSNPENKEAYDEAIEYAEEIGAEVVLATDPDADRLGCVVKHNGEWNYLTGNQTGALVLDYIINTRKELNTMPKNPYLFTTIVSGLLPMTIAKENGIKVETTLTGFKFIGDKAKEIEGKGDYLFGFEESYGFLVSDFVRDKDSVQAILMLAETACYYQTKGKDLVDALDDIYKKYGYYNEGITNIVLKGLEGKDKINSIIEYFRENEINLPSFKIEKKLDVLKHVEHDFTTNKDSKVLLPTSNVIKYSLNDNNWFVLRPSGTEPKLKVYYGVTASNSAKVEAKLAKLKEEILTIVDKLL